jgi:hypothetical protein
MKIQLEQIGDQFCISIKDGWFGDKKYIDIRDPQYKWYRTDTYFKHCLSTKDKVEELYNLITSKGKVIKSTTL